MSEAPPDHPATAWIDLERIRGNFKALRAHAGALTVIPVLKADAYGHGAIEVARELEPLAPAMFAVAYVSEGLALRRAGITTPILVLTGFMPDQVETLSRFQLTPVISTPEQVKALAARPPDWDREALGVHVKVDTGMSRLGFRIQELEPAVHRLEDADGIRIDGLMTHLASADEDGIATGRQLDLFDEAIMRVDTLGVRPRLIHAANSAGMASVRTTHTAVRPGLLLYGLLPRPLSPEITVKPAMELRARVALVKTLSAGERVSYGGRFVAGDKTLIATINAGYADGIPRTDAMRTKGALRHKGIDLPVAGTVCMDLTMVDAAGAPEIAAGDEVTVFGEAPGAWDLANLAGTNAWQILTGVGPRVPRRYTRGGGSA